jgi:hypothetical protein
MISLAGTVWGSPRTSHLYAIFKGRYVYFGETGHVPPVRWKSHLTSSSDFLGKLHDADLTEATSSTHLLFVGICISCADDEPEAKRKIARRAIEAELHKIYELDPGRVAPATFLLSSAPPSPVSHSFSFDKAVIAASVYDLIVREYESWRRTSQTLPQALPSTPATQNCSP